MQETTRGIIYPIKFNYSQIKRYYNEIPDFIFYKLKSMTDIELIENVGLVQKVQYELGDDLLSTKGYVILFNNQNYMFVTDDNVIYHEMSHLVNRDILLKSFNVKYENLSRDKNNKRGVEENLFLFLDEFIAEYLSTQVLKDSKKYDELLIQCKRGNRIITNSDIAYYLGACAALKEVDNVVFKYKEIGEMLLDSIVLKDGKVVFVNTSRIKEIISNLGNYLK